jgi:hypothetical protein
MKKDNQITFFNSGTAFFLKLHDMRGFFLSIVDDRGGRNAPLFLDDFSFKY